MQPRIVKKKGLTLPQKLDVDLYPFIYFMNCESMQWVYIVSNCKYNNESFGRSSLCRKQLTVTESSLECNLVKTKLHFKS